MDLLQSGSKWLQQQRAASMAHAVFYYEDGTDAHEMTATIGQTPFETVDQNGVLIRTESKDFLIALADLETACGANYRPKVGDKIVDVLEDLRQVEYVVNRYGTEDHWRWSDMNQQTLRIHTRAVGE